MYIVHILFFIFSCDTHLDLSPESNLPSAGRILSLTPNRDLHHCSFLTLENIHQIPTGLECLLVTVRWNLWNIENIEANNSFSIFFVHVNSQIEDPFAIAVHFIGFHLGRNCNRCLIEDDHFQKSFSWSLIFFWLKWTKNLRHCSAKFARNSRI